MKKLIKEDNIILDSKKLQRISNKLRKEIIHISYKKKAHHIGSCLSSADIIVSL